MVCLDMLLSIDMEGRPSLEICNKLRLIVEMLFFSVLERYSKSLLVVQPCFWYSKKENVRIINVNTFITTFFNNAIPSKTIYSLLLQNTTFSHFPSHLVIKCFFKFRNNHLVAALIDSFLNSSCFMYSTVVVQKQSF